MNWKYVADKKEGQVGNIPVFIVFEDGSSEPLASAAKHSPDGFQIGYGGSGPSELAYSLLIDYYIRSKSYGLMDNIKKAEKYYQQFKNDFVVEATEHFEIDNNSVGLWLEVQEYETV